MFTGQQKAQILLTLLEDNASAVLSHLPEDSAQKMTAILDSAPDTSDEELHLILEEAFNKIQEIQSQNEAIDTTSDSDNSESSPIQENFSDELSNSENDYENLSSIASPDVQEESQNNDTPQDSPYNDAYRSPQKIAALLKTQSTQLVSFFMLHCDPDLKEKIENELPASFKASISKQTVSDTPISKSIYQSIFNEIVLKKEDDIEDDSNNSSTDSSDDIFSF